MSDRYGVESNYSVGLQGNHWRSEGLTVYFINKFRYCVQYETQATFQCNPYFNEVKNNISGGDVNPELSMAACDFQSLYNMSDRNI